MLFALWVCALPLWSQLIVNQQNPAQLVQNVFVNQNSGVTISNINFQGAPQAIGFFNGANTNIGLNSGILMTTGNLAVAVGPNNTPSAGIDNNAPGFQPLTNIVGTNTFNASVLSFTFSSQTPDVEFRYVFASEEYPEYVGSQYNDVFAFFISGPGIVGTQNIALIPGTNTPVTINNVNAGSFPQFFVNNGNGITSGGSTIQFDGFTRPLVARATVIPCQNYTLTLAIADVGDAFYDSGVFLEASSFTGSTVEMTYQIQNSVSSTELAEGCGELQFKLTRTGNTSVAMTKTLHYTGSATYGVDYTAAPTTVTFAPGQTEISFTIQAFIDNIAEGTESVTISIIDTTCAGIRVTDTTFFIVDTPPPISVSASDDVEISCPGQQINVSATATGGAPPYVFSWSNGMTGENIVVNVQQSTTLYVSVAGNCANEGATDSVRIVIKNYTPMSLNVSTDTVICQGKSITLGGVVSGGSGTLQYNWIGAQSNGPFISITPTSNMQFTMVVTDSCNQTLIRVFNVQVVPIKALYTIDYVNNNVIQFTDLSFENIVFHDWNFGPAGNSNLQNPLVTFPDTGTFPVRLIVTNTAGCSDTIVNPIKVFPPFNFYIPSAFTPNGDGLNDTFGPVGEGFSSYRMDIFNRWGEIIYTSFDYRDRWGSNSRTLIDLYPSGVYVYRITVGLPTGEQKQYTGRVTLVN